MVKKSNGKKEDVNFDKIKENCEKIILATIIKDDDCGEFLEKLLKKHKFSRISYSRLFKLILDLIAAKQPLKGLSKLIKILNPASDISGVQKDILEIETIKFKDVEYQFALGFLSMINR